MSHRKQPALARFARKFAWPIIFTWVALTIAANVAVPQLEIVGKENSVSLSPKDAPSVKAMEHIGEKFAEFDSDSALMIVLESEQPLGDEARRYYDGLVAQLDQDTTHVQHVQNFWGDRITSAGSQSEDGKAAYVQVHLAGNQGETQGTESVDAVRKTVDESNPPQGLHAYVTGQAALVADASEAGDKSMVKMTGITIAVIAVMLLIIYRKWATMFVLLAVVLVEMSMSRGLIAVLGHFHVFGLSTFVVSILTALAIAAGTDYLIFLVGRYHEARNAGEDHETAFGSAVHGVIHVIVGSGLTIAGALLCLYFTRLNYFSSLALPCSLGMLVVLTMALTLGPAVLQVAGARGLLDPKRRSAGRGWRRLGAAIVRWPAPILVSAIAITLIGLLALPGYQTSYNQRPYLPDDVPANIGYAAAERHFSTARLNPDTLMIETEHDMRNPVDMLVLDRIAKFIFREPGVARVQSITRPLGPPMEHGSVPFQMSTQSVAMRENLQFLHARMDDTLAVTGQLTDLIGVMSTMRDLMFELNDASHDAIATTHGIADTTEEIRDHIADFDDFVRPMRNYLYWEPHCFDIPICWSTRSVFDAMDGISTVTTQTRALLTSLDTADAVMPALAAQVQPMIDITSSTRDTLLTMHSTFSSMLTQLDRLTDTAVVMGQVFDESANDDMFYLPPDAFDSPDFQRGMELMMSADGRAARMTITHTDDPATQEGIAAVDPILQAAQQAAKGTPLANAKFHLAGTAATYKDIQEASYYDLLIAAIAAIILIFVVMVIITRSLVASVVIVGTVVLSLGASFGLSVLIWQHMFGLELEWLVLAMSVIVLLAVGSDYNLLFVSRLREEIGAGLNTGLIRAMGSTGGVVTAAGLVFAFTMISMIASDLRSVGQIGTTIGLGLLFDTFVVRSLITPSVAAMLGRWFWWPLQVRPRPVRAPWPSPAERDPITEPLASGDIAGGTAARSASGEDAPA